MTTLNTTLFATPVTAHGQVGRLAWTTDCSLVIEGVAGHSHLGDLNAVVRDTQVPIYGLEAVGEAQTFGGECAVVLPAIAATGFTVGFSIFSSDYPDGNVISSSIRPAGVGAIGRANPVYVTHGDVLVVVMA